MKDQYGLNMSGSAPAVAAYDRALGHLLRFQPQVAAEAEQAIATDRSCAMARALRAYVALLSSEWPDAKVAADLVAGFERGNGRERAHFDAIRRWLSGDWHGAGRTLDAILADHPMDALALAAGHQIDFFLGDAPSLRGRPERVRQRWDDAHPHRAYVDGMWAFGLEECGDYAHAEDAGLRAVATRADDVWGIHSVVHTYEMQGRIEEGLAYLDQRRSAWTEGTFLEVHLSWHYAIYLLEREDYRGALAIYDTVLHHARSACVALEMLDASGLLWRLYLDDVDTGGRWQSLADAWAAKAANDATPWYVFNDLHAVMAFVGAGRQTDAEARVAAIDDYARTGKSGPTNYAMVTSAGLAAARGLAAFGRADYAGALTALAPVRHHLSVFGGSHAQRDAYQRTLLVAAERAGERVFAQQLAEERLLARPTSAWARARRRSLRGR